MNNKNIFYLTISFLLLVTAFSSCKKDDEIGGTAVEAVSGEWWVQMQNPTTKQFTGNYYHILTYNTASNSSTEMWFEDHFWDTKFKVPVNVNALTFSGANIKNSSASYPITITVKNGKIINNAVTRPVTKAVTDSIYYEVEYSDDPGVTYVLAGYRRTRYAEDDH